MDDDNIFRRLSPEPMPHIPPGLEERVELKGAATLHRERIEHRAAITRGNLMNLDEALAVYLYLQNVPVGKRDERSFAHAYGIICHYAERSIRWLPTAHTSEVRHAHAPSASQEKER